MAQRLVHRGSVVRAIVVLGVLLAVMVTIPPPARATITLTAVATGFNGLIGIDHHEPTNQVVVSVNYPSGSPYNFELIDAAGNHAQFSTASGFGNEVKIATIRTSGCQQTFVAGELFTGNGVSGQIARIGATGTPVTSPWVTLPGETGLLRGSLFQDRYCAFNGDLIVVTTAGNVWRVPSSGVVTLANKVASLGTWLEGVTTVPIDIAKYGPWSGKILAGAEGIGCLYSIDASGASTCWALGINPEDLDVIPANENFYGVDYSAQTVWTAPPGAFAGMTGDLLVAQESPGLLYHVRWDAPSSSFQKTLLASVSQWEHVTFSSAGIGNPCPRTQGYWKNHASAWPVSSLQLGSQTYSQSALLILLRTPVRRDASLNLAHQLIAAKLNVAAGSNGPPILPTIAMADALLATFSGTLPYGVRPSSSTGQQMIQLAGTLDDYNNGLLTPNCVGPDSASEPAQTPELRVKPSAPQLCSGGRPGVIPI